MRFLSPVDSEASWPTRTYPYDFMTDLFDDTVSALSRELRFQPYLSI